MNYVHTPVYRDAMKWYKFDIRELTSADYPKWYALMSGEKQARVDRFRFADDKKRTVAGEILARKAIAEWCDVSAESIVFDKTETGKPYAKGLPVEFNISHSGDIVVCVVDDKPVGIDIEKIRPLDLKVAKRTCTDEELISLFGHTPTEQDFAYTTDHEILTCFFKLWTAKEAYGKCIGVGTRDIRKQVRALEQFNLQEEYIVSIYQIADSDA